MDDFNYALDRVIGGLEKKNKIISPKEKEIIAYHEAGHALIAWLLPELDQMSGILPIRNFSITALKVVSI